MFLELGGKVDEVDYGGEPTEPEGEEVFSVKDNFHEALDKVGTIVRFDFGDQTECEKSRYCPVKPSESVMSAKVSPVTP